MSVFKANVAHCHVWQLYTVSLCGKNHGSNWTHLIMYILKTKTIFLAHTASLECHDF